MSFVENPLQTTIELFKLRLSNIRKKVQPFRAGEIDQQMAHLLELINNDMVRLGSKKHTPQEVRAALDNNAWLMPLLGVLVEKVAEIRNFTVPGPGGDIPVRLYLPEGEGPFPVIVYYHGGGWVHGSIDTHDPVTRMLAQRSRSAVLSVDYRLAPENKCPAAAEDAYAVLQWVAAHAAEIEGDTERIAVCGDSAGGNLCIVVCQLAQQRAGMMPIFQVPIYPVTDLAHMDTGSYQEFAETGYGIRKSDMAAIREYYLVDEAQALNPLASPLLAEELSGLPPALVVTAEFDVLRDDGEAYAKRLQAAGVFAQIMRCQGMGHGFISAVGVVQRAEFYMDVIVGEFRKVFYGRANAS